MLQEGPVTAVRVAVAAQLQLASTSCTFTQQDCTSLAPYCPVYLSEVAATCRACLALSSSAGRLCSAYSALQGGNGSTSKPLGKHPLPWRARPCFCRLSRGLTTFSLSQKEEWWTPRRNGSRA